MWKLVSTPNFFSIMLIKHNSIPIFEEKYLRKVKYLTKKGAYHKIYVLLSFRVCALMRFYHFYTILAGETNQSKKSAAPAFYQGGRICVALISFPVERIRSPLPGVRRPLIRPRTASPL